MTFGKGLNRKGGAGNERQGRNKGGSMGPGGSCVCMKCGTTLPHKQGEKCTALKCPKCGHVMVREELVEKKKSERNA